MKRRRKIKEPRPLTEQYISKHEILLMRQKQAINRLKKQRLSTADAERHLKTLELHLLELRNHRNIVQELIGDTNDATRAKACS